METIKQIGREGRLVDVLHIAQLLEFWLLEFWLLEFWLGLVQISRIHIKYCLHCILDRFGEVFPNSAVAVLDVWQTQFICHILHEISLIRPVLILCSMAVNNPCIIYHY